MGRLCLAQPAMQGDPIDCCAQGKAAGSSTDDMLNAALGPNSSSNSMVGHARYSYHAAYVSTVVIGACILAFTVGVLIWRLFQLRSVGGGRGEGFCPDISITPPTWDAKHSNAHQRKKPVRLDSVICS